MFFFLYLLISYVAALFLLKTLEGLHVPWILCLLLAPAPVVVTFFFGSSGFLLSVSLTAFFYLGSR